MDVIRYHEDHVKICWGSEHTWCNWSDLYETQKEAWDARMKFFNGLMTELQDARDAAAKEYEDIFKVKP